ncbi:MAG: hypothetical protein MSG64_11555 [Pyrinomonadaceae bacterium MAG19_C2-C3]|nr:hypothetical protein [Pyrinomonadaceae bacterium MAG19_C2-C3]
MVATITKAKAANAAVAAVQADAPTAIAPAQVTRGERAKWWRRHGTKRRFRYETSDGAKITDDATLERIKSLVIPPAWTEVRINPRPRGSLQAIGIDALGRVQRIYHPSFALRQQQKKYARIERFGELLPGLRRATNEHLAHEALSRERVLAVVVRLINELYFRIGSEESVKRYKTYGVTTLRNRHLEIKRGKLVFSFVGKHHIKHRRIVVDKDLATLMRDIKALGGAKLFHYVDDEGRAHAIRPRDVNEYIKSAIGENFSAKDFRTWGGTMLAATNLAEIGKAETERQAKTNVVKAVKRVAEHLGNTPAVCRSCYIHPAVMERYMEGITLEEFTSRRKRRINRTQAERDPEEEAVLQMLKASTKDTTTLANVERKTEKEVKA